MAELFCSVSSCSTLNKSSRTRSKISFAVRSEMAFLPELSCCGSWNWRGRKICENSPMSTWRPLRLPSFSHSRCFALLPQRWQAHFVFLGAAREPETANPFLSANGPVESPGPHRADFATSDTSRCLRTISGNPSRCPDALRLSYPQNSGKFRPTQNFSNPAPEFSGNRAKPRGNESRREFARSAPVQAGGGTHAPERRAANDRSDSRVRFRPMQ